MFGKPLKRQEVVPSSHICFFADDLILFAEATEGQIKMIKEGLDIFAKASGQCINFGKSNVLFSPNVTDQ